MLNNGNPYILCNQLITGCSTDVYGGFFTNRESFVAHGILSELHYSCHSCAPGYLPFLFAPLTSGSTLVQLSFKPFTLQNNVPDSEGGDELQI